MIIKVGYEESDKTTYVPLARVLKEAKLEKVKDQIEAAVVRILNQWPN